MIRTARLFPKFRVDRQMPFPRLAGPALRHGADLTGARGCGQQQKSADESQMLILVQVVTCSPTHALRAV
jgi:hypothetical protein